MADTARPDPYLRYVQAFFGRWIQVYDLAAAAMVPAYREAVRRADPRPGRAILDLCSGTGQVAIRCARRGAAVTAVDVTRPMLARAARKAKGLPIAFLLHDVRRLPFADATFDVALVAFGLHDMPFRARVTVLREAVRVAREGVIVLDYDFPGPPWRRALAVALVATWETAYLRDYARRGVAVAADAAGLARTLLARPRPGLCAVSLVRGGPKGTGRACGG